MAVWTYEYDPTGGYDSCWGAVFLMEDGKRRFPLDMELFMESQNPTPELGELAEAMAFAAAVAEALNAAKIRSGPLMSRHEADY